MARSRTVHWGFDQQQQALLLAATTHLPTLREVVERARPYEEIAGLLLLRASIDELDQIYTLVEDLTDGTRSRRRRDLLDGLRASLCGAMDTL
jgi:hypothetical protein